MSELTDRLSDAYVLAELLPADLPTPALCQDDDGDVSMEWYAGAGNVVCIWMRDRRVSYAGMIDGKGLSGHTSERAVLSPECITLIRSVVDRQRVKAAPTQGKPE